LKEFDAFHNRKLLLLAQIKLSTLIFSIFNQFMVVFSCDHLVAANVIDVASLLLDGGLNPRVLIYGSRIEISHLQFGIARLDLVSKTLMLVYQQAPILLNLSFYIS
jgi:hypothetical protein